MRVEPDDVVAPTTTFGRRLTDVAVGSGLPDVDELVGEFLGYADIILGRVDPPTDGMAYLDLMEICAAYYARAKEVEMLILWSEQQRKVIRGSPHYKFRTGQLRSFLEMSKMMADLGVAG